jgi:hypothetical protein
VLLQKIFQIAGFYKTVTLLKKQGKKLADMDEQAVLFDRRTDEEIEAERVAAELQKSNSLEAQKQKQGRASMLGLPGLDGVTGGATSMMGGATSMMGGATSMMGGGATSLMSMGKGVFSGLSSASRSSASASKAASEASSEASDPNAPKKTGWAKLKSASMKLKAGQEAAKLPSVADVAIETVLVEQQKRRSSIMSMGAKAMKKAVRASIIGTSKKGTPIVEDNPDDARVGDGPSA